MTEAYYMEYWVVFKRGKYISGVDELGCPILTTNSKEAWKFTNFSDAFVYFNLGYAIFRCLR